jgi:hypothetical protein
MYGNIVAATTLFGSMSWPMVRYSRKLQNPQEGLHGVVAHVLAGAVCGAITGFVYPVSFPCILINAFTTDDFPVKNYQTPGFWWSMLSGKVYM